MVREARNRHNIEYVPIAALVQKLHKYCYMGWWSCIRKGRLITGLPRLVLQNNIDFHLTFSVSFLWSIYVYMSTVFLTHKLAHLKFNNSPQGTVKTCQADYPNMFTPYSAWTTRLPGLTPWILSSNGHATWKHIKWLLYIYQVKFSFSSFIQKYLFSVLNCCCPI